MGLTYGLGGFDPTKPDCNVVEVTDDGQPDPTPAPIDPVEALKSDLTAAIKAAPNTIAGVKAAILGAVADQ